MEALDNKYLIIVKEDGTIDAMAMDKRIMVKNEDIILKLVAKGWTVILNGEYQNKIKTIQPIYMFFPSIFKSYEQISISLELFNYYSNNNLNTWYNFYDEKNGLLEDTFKSIAKTRLERAKSELAKRHELEYISKRALMLIYPDGKIESMLENPELNKSNDNYHLYYYTELYKSSPHLRKMLPNFIPYTKKTIDTNHNDIDNALVNNNTAVFINQDIGKEEIDLRTCGLSLFRIFLPKDYGSVKQTEKIEEILKKYPEYRMNLGRWDDKIKRCSSTYLTDVLEDIALKKELIRKEGK